MIKPEDLPLPKWEHGYRCHGYWLNGRRHGHVSLSPPGFKPVVYSWGLDHVEHEKGECKTLEAAKRRVESAFKRCCSRTERP